MQNMLQPSKGDHMIGISQSDDFRAYPQNAEQQEKVRRVKGSAWGEPHWFFPQDLP